MNKLTYIMIAVLSFLCVGNAMLGAYNARGIRENSRAVAYVRHETTMLVGKYYFHLSGRIDSLDSRMEKTEKFVRKTYCERSVSPIVFPKSGWGTEYEVTTNMPALGECIIQLCSEERQ